MLRAPPRSREPPSLADLVACARAAAAAAAAADFFAKKDKKKKKKKKAKGVDASMAMEVLAPRGKDVSVSTEKAAKEMNKKTSTEDSNWAADEKPKVAERLVTGMSIAKLEKKVEEEPTSAETAAVKDGASFAASTGGEVDQSVEVGASVEVEAAPEPEAEAKPENGGNYVYKPKLHLEEGPGGGMGSRRAAKFEMAEEMFPDLGAAVKGEVKEGMTGANWSDAGPAKAGGQRYSRGGGDASRPGMGMRGGAGAAGGASGGMPDDNYVPGAARGRLKLAPRSKPVGE